MTPPPPRSKIYRLSIDRLHLRLACVEPDIFQREKGEDKKGVKVKILENCIFIHVVSVRTKIEQIYKFFNFYSFFFCFCLSLQCFNTFFFLHFFKFKGSSNLLMDGLRQLAAWF